MYADADRAGFKGFRAKQLFEWLYRHQVQSLDEATNLPEDFKQWVTEHYQWGGVELASEVLSEDGSRKLLWRLSDGLAVEGVLMFEEEREEVGERLTLCVSSQVGCPLECTFCLTGRMRLKRQLRTDEIIEQVRAVIRLLKREEKELTNVVFMGMGEPLLNLDQLLPALQLLTSPQAFKLSSKRVTVSTAGHVPGIEALARLEPPVSLAVSLNAVNDELRSRLMPVNRRWPIKVLLEACRNFPLKNRRRITFEYVLLNEVNDSPQEARELVRLLHGIPNKVNLLPWNPDDRLPYQRPSEERIKAFRQVLVDHHISTFVRMSKGLDIAAACGQLATDLDEKQANSK